MGKTFINLRQLFGNLLTVGSTAAGDQGLVTINKGTAAASTLGLDVKGSAQVGGDLTVIGNLNITGSIDQQSVTNLAVADKTITVNKGGTTAGAASAGLKVEGSSAATIGAILFDATKGNKFTVGDGTTQNEIATVAQITAATAIYHRAAVVTGTQDATNKAFVLGATVLAGSEQVFLNGQLLTPGSSNDYVLAGTALTFQAAADAPLVTDVIRVYGGY